MHDLIFLRKIIRILGRHLPVGKIPILKDWIESSDRWALKNLISSSEWVERLIFYIKEENIQLDRFFIYLCGVMVDLNEKTGCTLSQIKKKRNQSETTLVKTVARVFKNDPSTKKFFELQLENADVIKKIFGVVGEENLFKIIFLRNKYCHPYLTEYFIKTYLNGEHEEIEFDRNKYDKLISVNIDELELTNDNARYNKSEKVRKLARKLNLTVKVTT
jgi:hypothetical protein